MGFPFVKGLELADGVGIAPTQPGGSLGFRDRGITALPTIQRNLRFWIYDFRAICRRRISWGS